LRRDSEEKTNREKKGERDATQIYFPTQCRLAAAPECGGYGLACP
jgi:hypothetical protein